MLVPAAIARMAYAAVRALHSGKLALFPGFLHASVEANFYGLSCSRCRCVNLHDSRDLPPCSPFAMDSEQSFELPDGDTPSRQLHPSRKVAHMVGLPWLDLAGNTRGDDAGEQSKPMSGSTSIWLANLDVSLHVQWSKVSAE